MINYYVCEGANVIIFRIRQGLMHEIYTAMLFFGIFIYGSHGMGRYGSVRRTLFYGIEARRK